MSTICLIEGKLFKRITNYENLYAVSMEGDIYSFRRKSLITPENNSGYMRIALSKNGTVKRFLVHRLVAQEFIPNFKNLPQVNHKDENKLNNNVDNLEWCTAQYNNTYGTRIDRAVSTYCLKYCCIETGEIATSREFCQKNHDWKTAGISRVANGKRKTYKGFHFIIVDDLNGGDAV